MRQFVKARPYVPLQDPLCRPFRGQDNETLFDGVRRGAFGTKSIGVSISDDFLSWLLLISVLFGERI